MSIGVDDLEAIPELRPITDDLWARIPWRTRGCTLVVLHTGSPRFAQTLGEKQAALRLARAEGCPVLLAWTEHYHPDIFRLDELDRVERLVAPAGKLSAKLQKTGKTGG